MIFVKNSHLTQQNRTFMAQQQETIETGHVDIKTDKTIPLRYQDWRDGINLERVRHDQHQARRQVLLAMLKRLKRCLTSAKHY